MPFRLPPSLNPFASHLKRDALLLRTLRLATVLCIVMIPAFGIIVQRASPGFVDPWWVRTLLTALAAVFLATTYVNEWARKHAPPIFGLFLIGLLVWFVVLTALNGLEPTSALGFVFVYFAVGTILALITNRDTVVMGYTLLGLGSSIGVVLWDRDPTFDPFLFLLTTTSTALLLFISTSARIRDRQELSERERTLSSAETLGAIGSWSYDIETGYRRWSDGMYRLTGATREDGRIPTVREHLPPELYELIDEAELQLLEGKTEAVAHRHPILRADDGSESEVRSIVQLIRDEDGAPRRLVGVVIDITSQAEHERQLMSARREAEEARQEAETARQEAEEAAALKSAILANMSHEIRTPLTAVIGYAQILRDETPEDVHDLVLPIETGGHRLLETLNAVLDYAQLEAGSHTLARERIDAASLARETAESFREPAETVGLAFSVVTTEVPVYVVADAEALSRSLRHLIGNAIKFTSFGSIQVSVEAEGDDAVLRVSDTGQGMAPEFREQLFEPFRQESTGSRRTHEGSGLGLAVTHRLIGAMGGQIQAQSALERGTTFEIRFPLAQAAPEELPLPVTTAWIARGERAHSEDPPEPSPIVRAPADA
ncbi:MAG: PAS domain-containing sensor histidine kinase [Bacteroidota bacterium]